MVGAVGQALLLFLAALAGARPAEAQDPASARIEIANVAAWYGFVAHSVTDIGGIGAPVATLERSGIGESAAADVPPGCYVVVVTQIGGPRAGFEDPISNQPAFCVAPGETRVFDMGGNLPSSPGRNILNGEVRDPGGNVVSGAVVDFFLPPADLSPNQVRLLDHAAEDHRGAFESSQVSGTSNWVYATVLALCRVQTLTAPEGYRWSGGRRYLNRSACASDYTVAIAYPDSGTTPADGFIEIDIPAYDGVFGLSGTIGLADESQLPDRLQWFRALEYPFQARFALPPGCHEIELDLASGNHVFTSSGRAVQTIPACVLSGQSIPVTPRGEVRRVAYDPARPYVVGGFVDQSGAPVDGVQVDLFYGRADLTFDDLRRVDHSTDDYRGPFYLSTTAGPDGRWLLPTYQSCLVATFVAPDGYSFDDGRYRQQTLCQGADQSPVMLHADAGPVRFDGRVVTQSGDPVAGVLVDVFAPIEGVIDEELRKVDHMALDYRGSYTQTTNTGADGRFSFEAPSRCWVLTYIGDDRARFPTGPYHRQTLCPGDSPAVIVPDFDQSVQGTIAGAVTGGPQLVADLFTASAGSTSYQQMAGCVAAGETRDNPVGRLVPGL